jgi:AraC family transcriptional regulator, regulatory protein of adaptative response / methylated-DNA-[protein]-cysteine methyltransferase
MINYKKIDTPIGKMVAAENDNEICMLEFAEISGRTALAPLESHFNTQSAENWTPVLKKLENQLSRYFAHDLKIFDLPLIFAGSEFQRAVWNQLIEVPYGQTVNYGWIAEKLGKPKASRAVGLANGSNHIAIIVPCHRVIGKNGSLVGYGGKLWRKEWLLKHEGALLS